MEPKASKDELPDPTGLLSVEVLSQAIERASEICLPSAGTEMVIRLQKVCKIVEVLCVIIIFVPHSVTIHANDCRSRLSLVTMVRQQLHPFLEEI